GDSVVERPAIRMQLVLDWDLAGVAAEGQLPHDDLQCRGRHRSFEREVGRIASSKTVAGKVDLAVGIACGINDEADPWSFVGRRSKGTLSGRRISRAQSVEIEAEDARRAVRGDGGDRRGGVVADPDQRVLDAIEGPHRGIGVDRDRPVRIDDEKRPATRREPDLRALGEWRYRYRNGGCAGLYCSHGGGVSAR